MLASGTGGLRILLTTLLAIPYQREGAQGPEARALSRTRRRAETFIRDLRNEADLMRPSESRQHEQRAPHPTAPSPLNLPAERLRAPSLDEISIDIADPEDDLPLDESDRVREDAEPLQD